MESWSLLARGAVALSVVLLWGVSAAFVFSLLISWSERRAEGRSGTAPLQHLKDTVPLLDDEHDPDIQ